MYALEYLRSRHTFSLSLKKVLGRRQLCLRGTEGLILRLASCVVRRPRVFIHTLTRFFISPARVEGCRLPSVPGMAELRLPTFSTPRPTRPEPLLRAARTLGKDRPSAKMVRNLACTSSLCLPLVANGRETRQLTHTSTMYTTPDENVMTLLGYEYDERNTGYISVRIGIISGLKNVRLDKILNLAAQCLLLYTR